jgi:hypothetical protein
MKKYFSFQCMLLFSIYSFSQPLVINWQQCYGGNRGESGYTILKEGSNFVIFGESDSYDGQVGPNYGETSYWAFKIDSIGEIIWSKTYGGTLVDDLVNAIPGSDDGYILSGDTESDDGDVTNFHGTFDYWVVKIDTSGILKWETCLGGSFEDYSCHVARLSDGSYLCVGQSNSIDGMVTGNHGVLDGWVVKLDKFGSFKWEKSLGSTQYDGFEGIYTTTDDGALLCGWAGANDGDVLCNFHGGFSDAWLVKIDSSGNIEWQQCYGGTSDDEVFLIQKSSDNGYILVGQTSSNDGDVSGNHGDEDFWILKIDSIGTLEWQKCYGGSGTDQPNFIKQLSDGNYIIGGSTNSTDFDVQGNHSVNASYTDGWLIKITPTGELIWQRCFGGALSETLTDLIELQNGTMMILGVENSPDNSFDVQCNHHGTTLYTDVWLMNVTDTTIIGLNEIKNNASQLIVTPNPASGKISVTLPQSLVINHSNPKMNPTVIYNWDNTLLYVYSIDGSKIYEKEIPKSQPKLEFDVSTWHQGLYYFRLLYGDAVVAGEKVIVN